MSYRTLSPTADRDLALMGLLVAALASLMALGSAVVLGAAITTILVGGPWQLPDLSAWVPALFTVVGNPHTRERLWASRGRRRCPGIPACTGWSPC
jgi:hypothetical protein